MLISKICINRPVFAIVLNLLIVIAGIVLFFKLPLRGTSDIDLPVVVIETDCTGANAEFIEQNITNLIEKSIKTVKNINYISSKSSSQKSSITVVFKIEANIENSLNDIRTNISEISSFLPKDASSPRVSKINGDNWPSLWLTVTAPENISSMELTNIIEQRAQTYLERLNNVGVARIYSNSNMAIKIDLNPVKLYQYKLSPIEIEQAILSQNYDYPAGLIKTESREYVINLKGKCNGVEELGNIILKNSNGVLLKLKDVAKIEVSSQDIVSTIRYNGKQTIAIGLIKKAKANIIEMSDEVNKILPSLEKSLPKGVKFFVAYDAAVPDNASIINVIKAAVESLLIVSLIVYLFLGKLRISMVPLVAIPISILGCFSLIYFAGFSINIYTLLAMILAIGLVVDDAIVMLENIYRHYEEGLSPLESTKTAINEITYAILAMTITLATVYLPIGLTDGFVGKLFIEFAWTLAFCVIVSGFVALTLSPMMTYKILLAKKEEKQNSLVVKFNIIFSKLSDQYLISLNKVLQNKRKFRLGLVGCVLVMIAAGVLVKKEFLPLEDESIALIIAQGLEGTNTNFNEKSIFLVEDILSRIKEVKGYFFNVTSNQAFGFVSLVNWGDRNKSQSEINSIINKECSNIPGMSIFARNPSSMGGGGESPIEISLTTFDNFNELVDVSNEFLKELKNEKMFVNVNSDLKTSMPSINIYVNRDYAAKKLVDFNNIGMSVNYLIAGKKVSDFLSGNETYPILMSYAKSEKNKISDLAKIYVKNRIGEYVNLSNLAEFQEEVSVQSFNHYNLAKSVELTADLAVGENIANAEKVIRKISAKVMNNKNISMELLGDIKKMKESQSNSAFVFSMAILIIYLVLAAQFESFIDPLFILFSVPFSIVGGLMGLLLFGGSINLFSSIGMVTLIGLITKNSIMIVEFANRLVNEGMNVRDAVLKAAIIRLRPIAMTTLATIGGAIPLIITSGAGAEGRKSIGLVIVGGMLIGTFFTIFVIPVIYDSFKKVKSKCA